MYVRMTRRLVAVAVLVTATVLPGGPAGAAPTSGGSTTAAVGIGANGMTITENTRYIGKITGPRPLTSGVKCNQQVCMNIHGSGLQVSFWESWGYGETSNCAEAIFYASGSNGKLYTQYPFPF